MNHKAIGARAELFGAAAVVASLVYLTRQLQTTRLMMRPRGAFLVVGTAFALAACQPTASDLAMQSEALEAVEGDFRAAEIGLARPSSPAQAVPVAPRLIRSGSARVEVVDLDAAIDAAEESVEAAEGYVAGSDVSEGREDARSATLNLRVPSDAFDSVVDGLSDLGRVLSVSISSSDVTREYFDTETRLAVQEESVGRLRDLASRSGDLEDLLAAERELGRAVAELESLKGQLRYFDQRVAESDLLLTLVEPGAVVTSGAFRPVVVAFRDAVGVFAQSIAYLVYITVFIAPWVVLVALAWPLLKRWRRRRQDARQEPTTGAT